MGNQWGINGDQQKPVRFNKDSMQIEQKPMPNQNPPRPSGPERVDAATNLLTLPLKLKLKNSYSPLTPPGGPDSAS